MKELTLTKGFVAIVDEEDFDAVSQYKWTTFSVTRNGKTQYYARRTAHVYKDSKRISRCIFLHRKLMGFPEGLTVDHRNGNGLDNRRINLRVATKSQNGHNCIPRKRSKTGFRGVRFAHGSSNFTASITVNRKVIHLGTFPTAEDAARAYDRRAVALVGEFATLNFPE